MKNVLAEPDSSNINADLAELSTFSRQLLRDLEKEDIPIDNRILKQRINQWKNKSGGKKETAYFTDHYKWFTEYYKSKPRPSTGKPLAKSTLKPYNINLRILEDYEEHIGGRLAFQHVSLTFHSELI